MTKGERLARELEKPGASVALARTMAELEAIATEIPYGSHPGLGKIIGEIELRLDESIPAGIVEVRDRTGAVLGRITGVA